MADLPSMKMKRRANILVLMGTLAFAAVLTMNLFDIMVIDSQKYQKIADENQFGAQTIPASRGSIYSADGKILAQSATAYKIMIDPKAYRDNDAENVSIPAYYISQKLNVEKEKVVEAFQKDQLSEYLSSLPSSPALSEVLARINGKKIEDINKDLYSDFLSSELGIEKQEVIEAMEENSRCVYLVNKAEMPVKEKVLEYIVENGISCMDITPNSKRYYPQDNLASSVVGFLDYDGNGQFGIERKYDEELSGVDGVIITAQDAVDNQMPYRYSKLYEAKDGSSVYLTIDSMIQYYCESALNSTIEEADAAEYGCAIVMNAKTGAVLGMYSAPGFDLNNKGVLSDEDQALLESGESEYTESDLLEKMWKNKAISVINEPGSVFKVFTSSAALEEKTVSFESTFTCNGFYEVDGEKIDCHATSGHPGLPVLTFKDALAQSCNPSFMQIGLMLGAEKFSYYADAFGLRERTGIDLPGEVNSSFASKDGTGGLAESNVTLATSAFGQTNCLTPIQIITGYTAAINGGYLLKLTHL